MQNALFVLALAGILVGAYSLFLPSLRKRGVSLPFMRLVDDDEDDEDIDIGDDLDQPLGKAYRNRKEDKKSKGKGKDAPGAVVSGGGPEMSPLPAKKKSPAAP